jgi:Putative prokaryotic signal transducing protein
MKLIAVRSYDDYISAHIIMGRLTEENITCYLQNEHSVTISPFLSNLTGGIKLMVTEPQVERALELLNEFEKGNNSLYIV